MLSLSSWTSYGFQVQKSKSLGVKREFYSVGTDLFAFTNNAAAFKYLMVINSRLQSSHLVVKHINECLFRPISDVDRLI